MLTKVRDPLGAETEYRYDKNGNMTKSIDALDREVDYVYDSRNLLLTVTSPSGSANHTRFTYDAMDRLVTKTDLAGGQTIFVYDQTGRMLTTTDAVGSTIYTYHATGQISTVKDGMNRTTTYSYNNEGLLASVYTPSGMMGEYVKYVYDVNGRVSQVGAGALGTTDKTQYFYDIGVNGTGRLTKVRYYRDASNYDDANYFYDNAGRMTSLTDYDNSILTYTYDAEGNAVTKSDYPGKSTTYANTDTNRLVISGQHRCDKLANGY